MNAIIEALRELEDDDGVIRLHRVRVEPADPWRTEGPKTWMQKLQAAEGVVEVTGWAIRRVSDDAYLCLTPCQYDWRDRPERALRFARQVDADQYRLSRLRGVRTYVKRA